MNIGNNHPFFNEENFAMKLFFVILKVLLIFNSSLFNNKKYIVFSDFDRNRSRKPSVLNEIEMKVMSINPKDHSYPFDNLVFEGGGSKGHAYAGAIKVRTY